MTNFYVNGTNCARENPAHADDAKQTPVNAGRYWRCSLQRGHGGPCRAYTNHDIESDVPYDEWDPWPIPVIEESPI